MNFALDHANTRTLRAGVDCERGASNRHQRIAGIDKQTILLPGRLNDYAAAIEVNRRAAQRLSDREL